MKDMYLQGRVAIGGKKFGGILSAEADDVMVTVSDISSHLTDKLEDMSEDRSCISEVEAQIPVKKIWADWDTQEFLKLAAEELDIKRWMDENGDMDF